MSIIDQLEQYNGKKVTLRNVFGPTFINVMGQLWLKSPSEIDITDTKGISIIGNFPVELITNIEENSNGILIKAKNPFVS